MRGSRISYLGLAMCLTAAGVFSTPSAQAVCTSRDPTEFVSPGLVVSLDMSHHWAFGLGAEVSYSKWIDCETPVGPGAFTHATYYFAPARARFALGAQGNA